MSFSFEFKSLCISYLTNLCFMSSFRLQYPGNYILCIEMVILLPRQYWFLNDLCTDIIFLNIYIMLFESIVNIFLRFIQQVLTISKISREKQKCIIYLSWVGY